MTCCAHRVGLRIALVCSAGLAGCASITGLDGSSQYACKAPEGVKCDSVSGNYYNALQNKLPTQRKPTGAQSPAAPSEPAGMSTFRNVDRNLDRNLDSKPDRTGALPSPTTVETATGTPSRAGAPAASAYLAAPLRAGPRVLRLWIKPWEDADRDLNGESLVYVQVDNGRWLVDHVQRQAREPYAPIRPTRLPTSAGKGSVTDPRDADARPASQSGQASADDGSAVTQALRALQGRPTTSSTTPAN